MKTSMTENKRAEYIYEVVKETETSEILGEYITYGIKVTRNESLIELISDVSTDREKAERLASLCNDGQLHPIHIRDIIEDFLVDLDE